MKERLMLKIKFYEIVILYTYKSMIMKIYEIGLNILD